MLTAKEKLRSILNHQVSYANLAFKWAPREKSSKKEEAKFLRNALGMTPRQYRQFLAQNTVVTEQLMCAKNWNEINFSHVPSLAMSRYTKAFAKNAPESFVSYKEALKKGDPKVAKVNAGAVYPYDIVKSVRHGDADVADAQWEALPNYIGDASILPLVDVSGSMGCPIGNKPGVISCLDVAISLGLYCSDKNTGAFKDLFLTFTGDSKFVHLKGTLSQKIRQMSSAKWEMNTNLHSAFNAILQVATSNAVPAEDMPKILLILSDMQFDRCVSFDNSAIQMIRTKYKDAGYEVPSIVFWNLNDAGNVPVRFDERGTALVSGFSPSIMKSILAADLEQFTPEAIMKKTVLNERYDFE